MGHVSWQSGAPCVKQAARSLVFSALRWLSVLQHDINS